MKIGSIVECVDASNQIDEPECKFPNGKLVRGESYTVISLTLDGAVRLAEKPVMWRRGLNIKIIGHKKERFRELLPPQTQEIAALLSESETIFKTV